MQEVWNLKDIFGNETYESLNSKLDSQVSKFKGYRKELEDADIRKIKQIIDTYEEIARLQSQISAYYGLKGEEDTQDTEALSKNKFLEQKFAEISNEILFFDLWFMHLEDKKANLFIGSAELKDFKFFLEGIRKQKKYTKSEDVEQILNIKNITGRGSFADIYKILTNKYSFDWEGKKANKEEVISAFTSSDPQKREKAYQLVLGKYGDESVGLAEIYKDIVLAWCNEGIKIRGYDSSISIRNNGYDVTDKAVETLLDVVRKNTELFKEYFKLKYKLNSKTQKYPFSRYHIYAPFDVKTKEYPYEDAKKLVLDTYKQFDVRFYDNAMKLFEAKHVHSHPSEKKRSGAFCYDINNDILPYILLNHTDRLKDAFTMIHEFGHGIHDIHSAKQKNLVRHPSLTIAETASVFSEMVLADRLLRESDSNEDKKYILMQHLDNQYATIIRQAYFVIFEKQAHEMIMNGATKEDLDEMYLGLLKEQFGSMEIPPEFKHEWNYIPHIHETPFYCYAYSWGNLFVLSLYDMYKKEGKPFIDKYVQILETGGSKSPADTMNIVGANPESEEFWQRGFDIIKEEIEELKKLA